MKRREFIRIMGLVFLYTLTPLVPIKKEFKEKAIWDEGKAHPIEDIRTTIELISRAYNRREEWILSRILFDDDKCLLMKKQRMINDHTASK